MCVALALPPKVEIEENVLRACFTSNPDGAGYGYYADDGSQVINKGFFSFKAFYEAFKKDRESNMDKPFLVHFRIRTHGAKNESNCHPFALDNAMLIHNGWVDGLGNYGSEGKSDTAELAEKLKAVPLKKVARTAKAIEPYIGYSVIVFLDKTGTFHFSQQQEGKWIDGVFFSNTNWKYSYERLKEKAERWEADRRRQDADWEGDGDAEMGPPYPMSIYSREY